MTTSEQQLHCDHCRCVYKGSAEPGQRCNDLSWVPNQWTTAITFASPRSHGLGIYRKLRCRGRVWPVRSSQLQKRWTREQLREEQNRLGKWIQSLVEARRAKLDEHRRQIAARRAERRQARDVS